jgi:hypothetical protein
MLSCTQDNAVIVITKAASILHLINLKKKLFYTKFLTSDFLKLTKKNINSIIKSNNIKNLKIGFIFDVGFVIVIRVKICTR